jgi:hypothetical protein
MRPTGDEDDEQFDEPRFVHLRDAKVLIGDGVSIPRNRGTAFRARIDSVDGWIHGVLSQA